MERFLHALVAFLAAYFLHTDYAISSQGAGSDVVTLKNGDIYHGTAAQEIFTLQTEYGVISIPYDLMALLVKGNDQQPDRIITRLDDQFSGQLLDNEIKILRILGPMLPVHTEDISDIVFTPRQTRTTAVQFSHAVIMNNHDHFTAHVHTGDIMLLNDSSLKLVQKDDIQLLDITFRAENSQPLIQVTNMSGHVIQGQVPSTEVKFNLQNRYGQSLNVPVSQFSSITFKVNYLHNKPDFNFRRHPDTSRLFSDPQFDGRNGPEMLRLAGDKYLRGDMQGDGDNDEKPPVPVTTGPFAISVFEITFEQYDRFCIETSRSLPDDEGWGRAHRPVINVSWQDAVAYTQWLSDKTGKKYRLPTDAEWEYAARAGTDTRYWWGNETDRAHANCEGCGSLWDGEKTAPVGRFSPNAFGLHDTAGNVFEWVADCYHDSFADAPENGAALDKPDCGKRVIRGGAWSFPAREIRSANRWRDFPTRRSDDTGFRVARDL